MSAQSQTQKLTLRIYLPLIGDFVSSVILGFICISFLATGVVYPIATHDQQLLKAWGMESFFDAVLLLLLLTSLILTSFIYHKSISGLLKTLEYQSELPTPFHKTWFELGPLWIVASVAVVYIVESFVKWVIFSNPLMTSTVISNILLYLLAGYVIGQTLVKTTNIFLWEHRNSARIFLNLEGKLLRRP
jgi:hypothetical protein